MPEIKQPTVSLEVFSAEQQRSRQLPGNLSTALALGVVSVAAFELQRRGITNQLPFAAESISESMSHPVLGYVGASIGIYTSRRWFRERFDTFSAWAVASSANFAAEYMQSVVHSSPEAQDFLSGANRNETAKDWCFALLGAGLLLVQSAKTRSTSTK